MEEPGGLQSLRVGHDWVTSLSLHFHALEKEMATHSSVLAWRIPGMGEPGGLPSLGSHRVGHDWSDLAAAVAAACQFMNMVMCWHFLACPGKKYWWSKVFSQNQIPFVVAAYFAGGYLLTSVPVYVHTLSLPVVPQPFHHGPSEFSPAFEIVQMCV